MKELKPIEKIYLEDYDVYVNPYLTYAQIQQIANSMSLDWKWAEGQINLDTLVLYHATNLSKEEIEGIEHDLLFSSGLIEAVYKSIRNLDQLKDALDYKQSFARGMTQLMKNLPKMIKPLKEAVDKHERSSKK